MKFGVCTGPENIETAAKAGFDFIECMLYSIEAMDEEAFQALAEQAPSMPIPISRCNCFLPPWLKVTGPDTDEKKQRAYLDNAFSRAKKLGVEMVMFGSGGARQVPDGFPMDEAWRQLIAFTRMAAEYAEKYEIQIALEPLRAQECNFFHLMSEANVVSAVVNHPLIGVMADSFHMDCGGENMNILKESGDKLWHIHISHPFPDRSSRDFPRPDDDGDYQPFIDVLKEMNYQGYVSVEGGTQDFETDAPLAVARIKPLL